jgi:hypothetical protein
MSIEVIGVLEFVLFTADSTMASPSSIISNYDPRTDLARKANSATRVEVWVLAKHSKQRCDGMHTMWCLSCRRDKKAEETSGRCLSIYKEVHENYHCN